MPRHNVTYNESTKLNNVQAIGYFFAIPEYSVTFVTYNISKKLNNPSKLARPSQFQFFLQFQSN